MMRFWFSLTALVLMLTGCMVHSTQEIEPGSVPFPRTTQSIGTETRDAELFPLEFPLRHMMLREGDTINVSLWGEEIISGEYPIGPDGFLTIPLVGDIPASNTLRQELRTRIAEKLRPYYDSPQLEVSVSQYAPREAYVLGGVNLAGPIELEPRDKLLSVIAKAGGIQERTNDRGQSLGRPESVRIVRDGTHRAVIGLTGLLEGSDPRSNIAVVPGDIIYIPRDDTQTIMVMGEVRAPGLLGLAPGMDLTEAIALADGFTRDAIKSKVRVVRRWWQEEPDVFVVDFSRIERGSPQGPVLLEDQDIVFVPTKSLGKINYVIESLSPSFSASPVNPATAGAGGAGGP